MSVGRLIFFFILICLAGTLLFLSFVSHAPTTGKVGIVYYVWYKDAVTDWDYPIVDKPVLGYYASDNETVIRQHLTWFEDLMFDFVIISWWGANSFHDNVTKKIFQIADVKGTFLKFCLQVEPCPATENQTHVYEYVYQAYVQTYSHLYFNYRDKPLLLWYHHYGMNPNFTLTYNDKFTSIITGITKISEWCDKSFDPYHEGDVPRGRHWSITPRFDESRLEGRIGYVNDSDYSQGLYVKQWEDGINYVKNGTVEILEITTWNEYAERTMIEPHYDATAFNQDPYYIYNLTKYYVNKLKEDTAYTTSNWYNRICAATFIVIISVLIMYNWRLTRTKKFGIEHKTLVLT